MDNKIRDLLLGTTSKSTSKSKHTNKKLESARLAEITLKTNILLKTPPIFQQKHYKHLGVLTITDYVTFTNLPEHPIWSKLEKHVDFTFADQLCTPLYTLHDQRPYAPSIRLKALLVQHYESLSPRELELQFSFDMAIKRFIGIPMSYRGCDYKELSWGANLVESNVLESCFTHILIQARPYLSKKKEGARWCEEAIKTYVTPERLAMYPYMMQGLLHVVQHMKRTHPILSRYIVKVHGLEGWFVHLPSKASLEEKAAAMSILVIRAFTILGWFETDSTRSLFWLWKDPVQQLRSLELQAILYAYLSPTTQTMELEFMKSATNRRQHANSL